MTPDDTAQKTSSEDLEKLLAEQSEMEMPGISNVEAPKPILPEDDDVDAKEILRRTRLHELVNEIWGYGALNDGALRALIKYADPDMAEKQRTGFSVKLLAGGKIMWAQPTERSPFERISCLPKDFTPEAAASMISLARLRGWKTLSVTGSVEQKELMWLEAQRQNLKDYEAHLAAKEKGLLPKDADGKEAEYKPLTITNFSPLEDSPAYQQWLSELEAWQLSHLPTPMVKEGSPEDKAEKPVPEQKAEEAKPEDVKKPEEEKKPEEAKANDVKPEDQKPVAEKKDITWSEAQQIFEDAQHKKEAVQPEAEKKPEPHKKDAKAGNLKSKFIKVAKPDGKSRFMNGPGNKQNAKPHNNTVKVTRKARNNTHKPH